MAKLKLPKDKDLLDAGVHFGHQVRRWHPNMEQYIYSVQKNIHIIDLEDTETLLKEACEYLYELASTGSPIIFVGTKRQAKEVIKNEATRCGASYVNERWLGGTMTNFGTIRKNIKRYIDLLRQREEGELAKYTKKEQLLIDRNIQKLELSIGGISSLNRVPDAIVVIDAKREKTAIREASVAGVKVVGLVDTNTDPTDIDYVVPGNDDGIKSIALIVKAFADSVEAGYKDYAKKEAKEKAKRAKDDAVETSETPKEENTDAKEENATVTKKTAKNEKESKETTTSAKAKKTTKAKSAKSAKSNSKSKKKSDTAKADVKKVKKEKK